MDKIALAKQLLQWKHARINQHSTLTQEEISEFFAEKFQLFANERQYDGNHENYLEFLNEFKKNIDTLSHQVHQYHVADDTVIMPMRASITDDNGSVSQFEAVMLLHYNEDDKIIEWREVCVEVS